MGAVANAVTAMLIATTIVALVLTVVATDSDWPDWVIRSIAGSCAVLFILTAGVCIYVWSWL